MTTTNKKSILIEGWRFLPHSYAVVNAFQILQLVKRGDVELFHHDVPYYSDEWKPMRGLLKPEEEAAIAGLPRLPTGMKPDAILRITFPYNLHPAVVGGKQVKNVVVFGTAEMHAVPMSYIAGGKPLRVALEQNPNVRIITPSNWSKAGFVQSGAPPERISVVPHGIDTSIHHPIDEPQRQALRQKFQWNGFMFLSVGAMTPGKGLTHLLTAFAAVARRHPHVQLVMKGMDALYRSRDMLLAQAEALSDADKAIIDPRLHYRGDTLAFADVALMYQMADAYVSPYIGEGFNMPVLEAAACGVPVICTAGGPTDDFTKGDFALRIPAAPIPGQVEDVMGMGLNPDVSALANHMLAVIEKPEIRQCAREAGPAFVRTHFTWKHAVDRLVNVIFPN